MGAAAVETVGPCSRVCRLRGLPYSASIEDVAQFFRGYSLEEVYICKRDGRSTGEAYCVFETPPQANTALLKLNKQYMGSRYIELFEAAEADLAAVKKVLEDTRLQGCVVRLRGLPYTATAADVVDFFQGVRLAEGDDAIVFTHTVDGRPTGEAYIELADKDAQTAAMMRHKELMGSRYIEIFHSSKMDKLQAQQQRMVLPSAMFGRWNGQTLRPDAAAQRGLGPLQPGMLSSGKGMPYGAIDQLTSTLQGTHLSSPIPVAPPMSQPLRLPAAGPVPSTVMSSPQAFVQQKQQQQLPSVQALPASTLGLPAAIVAMSSGLSAAPRPAASAGASPVVDACQPTMWVVPRSATPPGAPVVLGPDGQPVPHQMYYTMHPMQQGIMAPPYPGSPYTSPAGSGPADQQQMMALPGHPRPMLVGGGQWMSSPPPWPQPGWPSNSYPGNGWVGMIPTEPQM